MLTAHKNIVYTVLSVLFAALLIGVSVYFQILSTSEKTHHKHIVFLISPGEDSFTAYFDAFKKELPRLHSSEDSATFSIVYRDAAGSESLLDQYIDEAARTAPDVIVTISGPAVLKIQHKNPNTPIIAALGDPVENGYISSLHGSGDNIAGIAYQSVALTPKRLEILKKLSPTKINRIAIFYDTLSVPAAHTRVIANKYAREIGVELKEFPVTNATRAQLSEMLLSVDREHFDGLMFYPSASLFMNSDLFLAQAAKEHLPIIMPDKEALKRGATVSYGPDYSEMGTMVARVTNRVLEGASAANMPFRQSVKINFTINAKVMEQLGFTISSELSDMATKIVNE